MNYWYSFIKSQRQSFFLLGVISGVYALGQSSLPYFIKRILNLVNVHSGDPTDLIIKNTLYLIVLWLLSSIAVVIQGKLLSRQLPLLGKNIAGQAIAHLQTVHHSIVTEISGGILSRKISDLVASSEKITHFLFVNIVNIVVAMLLTLILMVTVSYVFAALTLGWLGLHILNAVMYLRKGSQHARAAAETSSTLSGKLVDLFSNIRAVHIFANQEYEKRYLGHYLSAEAFSHETILTHLEKMKIKQSLLSAGFILLSVIILVILQMHHKITVGDFSMIMLLVFNIANVVWAITFQLISVVKDVGIFYASASTIFDIRNSAEKMTGDENIQFDRPASITFHNLSFRYPTSRKIFHHLSLDIAPGERVALSASSGKGKTTLINLLLGLYEPSAGKILINNKDIFELSSEARNKLISYVPQEGLFFNRTIFENVQYSNMSAKESEVYEACKIAQCHEFIMKLGEKYQTLMGEKGCYLSGGQLQRLAIARAILKKSPILIFDEPTSSLDEKNSYVIESVIKEASKKSTLILVSHRLSTLGCVDRVIQIDSGC